MTSPFNAFSRIGNAGRVLGATLNTAATEAAEAASGGAAAVGNTAAGVFNDVAGAASNFAANPLGAAMGGVGAAVNAVNTTVGNVGAGIPGFPGFPGGITGLPGGVPGFPGGAPGLPGSVTFPWPHPGGFVPPHLPPGLDISPVGPVAGRAPYTQLAQNAMALLRNASADVVNEAIHILAPKQLAGSDIVNWLERHTRVGEVLSSPAANWSRETLSDFAAAFQMRPERTAAMDAIVAIGLLNMPELENELRAENTSAATTNDLVQNRRIVAQYPPPGTPLQPPYVVLVAVEHQDTRRADEIVQSIVSNLVVAKGYKLPREAAAKVA